MVGESQKHSLLSRILSLSISVDTRADSYAIPLAENLDLATRVRVLVRQIKNVHGLGFREREPAAARTIGKPPLRPTFLMIHPLIKPKENNLSSEARHWLRREIMSRGLHLPPDLSKCKNPIDRRQGLKVACI